MRTALVVALALGLAACGGSGMHSGGVNSNVTATALDQAAQGAGTTVTAYGVGAPALATVPDCTAATQQYVDRMKPMLAQMDQVAGQMDSSLGSMGWGVHGDVQCSVASMSMELARHMAAACGAPDMTANRAEIAQHVTTMQDSANHMRMRSAEVMAMGGGSGMMGSGGGMGGSMGPGWTMPGGGMMSWDHHTPGCSGSAGTGGVSDPPPGAAFSDPPPAPTTRNGNILDVSIEARAGTSELGGTTASVLTYGGAFVAPVIQARRGDVLRVHFTNSLPASGATNLLGASRFESNLHVHGLHVTPGTNPDGVAGDDVFRAVAPGGGSLDYEHDLALQPAGSMGLYHPHMHGAVAEQIWGGMIGPINIADDAGSPLAAYETHVLTLKDLSLSGGAPTPYDSIMDYVTGKQGNLVMVNGQVNPVLPIRPGQVQRWRIFNASTARFYRLSLEGHSLQVIGTDGGLLDRPYPMTEILLAPAERVDVLVQASSTPGTFKLLALPYDRGGMGMMDGGMGGCMGGGMMGCMGGGMSMYGSTPSTRTTLLTVDDKGSVATDVLPVQVNPAAKRINLDVASLPRTRFVLGMMMGRGTINGVSFGEAADGTVTAYQHDSKVGTYEVWEIVNQTGMDHPWHQHVNSAQVISASGSDPAFAPYAAFYATAPALKDTVIVPKGGSITLLVPVLDHVGRTVFHCHIVEHEDIGMMGIWNIRP